MLTDLVKIQFKNRHNDDYSGPGYTYIADVPVIVGDLVNVPTKWGDKKARVSQVDVIEAECGYPRDKLLHITEPATIGGVFDEFFN